MITALPRGRGGIVIDDGQVAHIALLLEQQGLHSRGYAIFSLLSGFYARAGPEAQRLLDGLRLLEGRGVQAARG